MLSALLFKFCDIQMPLILQISYNVMLNVYAAVGLYSEAEELFKAMQRDGFSPDSVTYLALIKAYTESMKYREAELTILSMEKEGIQPSCAHYNLLISVFAKAGLIEEIDRVFNTMLASGLKPDMICCRTILRSYMDYGYVDKGISHFERIQKNLEPDRYTMSAAVHLYKSAGEDLRAEVVLNSMNDMGISFLRNLEIGSKARTLSKLANI